MGFAVAPGMATLFTIHSLIETGNISFFDLSVLEYHHFIASTPESERACIESWHPYYTINYFRRCLGKAYTAIMDNVITAADLDEVSPILDEIDEELDMIGIWDELLSEFIFNDCDFANFVSNLANYY